MAAPQAVLDLVARFSRHLTEYHAPHYNEARPRADFIDPLFTELGWDIANKLGYAELYRDVIHGESLKTPGATTKAPDYTFRVGGERKFFVEAKKPAIRLDSNMDAAFQIKRYAWSAKLKLRQL